MRESGGAPPADSPAAGLGSNLIDNAIPGAKVRREFSAEGLVCTIQLTLIEEDAHRDGL